MRALPWRRFEFFKIILLQVGRKLDQKYLCNSRMLCSTTQNLFVAENVRHATEVEFGLLLVEGR